MTADECVAAILAAEQEAADGIARETADLRGVVTNYPGAGPLHHIEQRWLQRLDARVAAIEREFDESNPIA